MSTGRHFSNSEECYVSYQGSQESPQEHLRNVILSEYISYLRCVSMLNSRSSVMLLQVNIAIAS